MPAVSAEYFTQLTAQVNAAPSCAALQSLVTASVDSINETVAAATAQLAVVTPMLALLTAPAANPDAIITYLNTLIAEYFTPQFASAVALAAQLTATTAAIATLTTSIEAKASSFASCSITIPT